MELAHLFQFPFVWLHNEIPCFVAPVVVLVVLVLVRPFGRGRRHGRQPGAMTAPPACPRCSTINRPVARFCANCGLRLG
jgi:hypothetical protein